MANILNTPLFKRREAILKTLAGKGFSKPVAAIYDEGKNEIREPYKKLLEATGSHEEKSNEAARELLEYIPVTGRQLRKFAKSEGLFSKGALGSAAERLIMPEALMGKIGQRLSQHTAALVSFQKGWKGKAEVRRYPFVLRVKMVV